jgi:hypothetical protein
MTPQTRLLRQIHPSFVQAGRVTSQAFRPTPKDDNHLSVVDGNRLCKQFSIDHRLIPPRHPQTNGMVERFNGRISDIVNQTRFGCASELESTLHNYVKVYNHNIVQRALKHQTPIQTLKKRQEMKPDLFVKRVYNQAGLDICQSMKDGWHQADWRALAVPCAL